MVRVYVEVEPNLTNMDNQYLFLFLNISFFIGKKQFFVKFYCEISTVELLKKNVMCKYCVIPNRISNYINIGKYKLKLRASMEYGIMFELTKLK